MQVTSLLRHLNHSTNNAEEHKYLRLVLSLGCSHRKTARSSRHALDQLTRIQIERHWHHWYPTSIKQLSFRIFMFGTRNITHICAHMFEE